METKPKGLIDYGSIIVSPIIPKFSLPKTYHVGFFTTFTSVIEGSGMRTVNSRLIKIIKDYSGDDGLYSKKQIFSPCGFIEGLAYPIGMSNEAARSLFAKIIQQTHDFVEYYRNECEERFSIEGIPFGWSGREFCDESIINKESKIAPLPLLFLLAQMSHYQDGDLEKALGEINHGLRLDGDLQSPDNMTRLLNGGIRFAESYKLSLECGINFKSEKYACKKSIDDEIKTVLNEYLKRELQMQIDILELEIKPKKTEEEETQQFPTPRMPKRSQRDINNWFKYLIGDNDEDSQ